MPLSNGKYVSPTWVNKAPPALDAAELQAITDTLVAAQNTGDANAEAIAALQSAAGGYAKIQVGSYTGTSNSTDRTSKKIACDFYPRAICIMFQKNTAYHPDYMWGIRPLGNIGILGTSGNYVVTWGADYVTLDYGSGNQSGQKYYYLILG